MRESHQWQMYVRSSEPAASCGGWLYTRRRYIESLLTQSTSALRLCVVVPLFVCVSVRLCLSDVSLTITLRYVLSPAFLHPSARAQCPRGREGGGGKASKAGLRYIWPFDVICRRTFFRRTAVFCRCV